MVIKRKQIKLDLNKTEHVKKVIGEFVRLKLMEVCIGVIIILTVIFVPILFGIANCQLQDDIEGWRSFSIISLEGVPFTCTATPLNFWFWGLELMFIIFFIGIIVYVVILVAYKFIILNWTMAKDNVKIELNSSSL